MLLQLLYDTCASVSDVVQHASPDAAGVLPSSQLYTLCEMVSIQEARARSDKALVPARNAIVYDHHVGAALSSCLHDRLTL